MANTGRYSHTGVEELHNFYSSAIGKFVSEAHSTIHKGTGSLKQTNVTNLKQNKAQSARAESTHKGVN